MASPQSGLCTFSPFRLLLLVPFPLPFTALTVISPLFPLLLHLGQFLRCRLRQRNIKLTDELQVDVYLLCPISSGAVRRVDENFVHELVDHRRGQYREVGVLLRQRKKLIHPGRVRVKSIQLRLGLGDGFLQRLLLPLILARPLAVPVEFPLQVFRGLGLPDLGCRSDLLNELRLVGDRIGADGSNCIQNQRPAGGLTAGLADTLIERVYVYPNNQLEIVWKMKDFCMEVGA